MTDKHPDAGLLIAAVCAVAKGLAIGLETANRHDVSEETRQSLQGALEGYLKQLGEIEQQLRALPAQQPDVSTLVEALEFYAENGKDLGPWCTPGNASFHACPEWLKEDQGFRARAALDQLEKLRALPAHENYAVSVARKPATTGKA